MFDKTVFSIKGIKGALVIQCIVDLLVALTTLGVALSLSSVIISLWNGQSFESQLIGIAIFIVSFIIRSLLNSLGEIFANRFSDKTCEAINGKYLQSLFALGPRFTKEHGSGYFVSLATEGLDGVSVYLATFLIKLPKMIIIPLCLLIAIGYLDLISLLICIVSYPLIIVFMQLIGKGAKAKSNERLSGFKAMSNHFIDSVRGIDEIKSFNLVNRFASTIYNTSEKYRELTMKTLRIATLSSSILDLFATGALAAVAIMLGFRMVDGDVAFFNGLAILIIVPEFFNPIKSYAADHHANLDGSNYLVRIMDVINQAKDVSGKKIDVTTSKSLNDKRTFATADDAIVAKNISFAYETDPQNFDIEDVSFRIPFNTTTAIVGKSGLGKTTIANLVAGFLTPQSGYFQIDGKKLSSLDIPDWQKRIAFIPQNPTIFNDSLKENIAFYRSDATDHEVNMVINSVGLNSFLNQSGLDAVIGEGGKGVSGGEAARIAIARALIDDDRDVWIFDEPGAHLDEDTGLLIRDTIKKLATNKTVIIITHEQSWKQFAENVIDLDGIENPKRRVANV